MYTQNISRPRDTFSNLLSDTVAVAYYSYLELNAIWSDMPTSYICNIVNETTSDRASFDEMRRDAVPLVPRMILQRIRKRVKDRHYHFISLYMLCHVIKCTDIRHVIRDVYSNLFIFLFLCLCYCIALWEYLIKVPTYVCINERDNNNYNNKL